jgi:hypothetical protein
MFSKVLILFLLLFTVSFANKIDTTFIVKPDTVITKTVKLDTFLIVKNYRDSLILNKIDTVSKVKKLVKGK